MPTSKLRKVRLMLRPTASPESMERLKDLPSRPDDARPNPSPAMVMEPDTSRYQRHSAHLKTRVMPSEVDLRAEVTVDLTTDDDTEPAL